jgi:hypothetical protein
MVRFFVVVFPSDAVVDFTLEKRQSQSLHNTAWLFSEPSVANPDVTSDSILRSEPSTLQLLSFFATIQKACRLSFIGFFVSQLYNNEKKPDLAEQFGSGGCVMLQQACFIPGRSTISVTFR